MLCVLAHGAKKSDVVSSSISLHSIFIFHLLCMYIRGCVHVCAHACGAKDSIRCLSQSLCPLIFEAGSWIYQSVTHSVEVTDLNPVAAFYTAAGDLNQGPPACITSTVLTEPSLLLSD